MADDLEVRVTITRKASTEHNGEDHVIASVASTMNSSDRERFLAFLVATYGLDGDGNQRTQQQIIEAFWQPIAASTAANIENWEREVVALAARNGVPPVTVTHGA